MAGSQPTDFSGERGRCAKGALKLCPRQHGLPSSDGDAPQGWGNQPWCVGGSSWRRRCCCQAASEATGSTWRLFLELGQGWPCPQELSCGQGTESPHERATGEVSRLVTLGRMNSKRSSGSSQRPLYRQKAKPRSGSKKGQLETTWAGGGWRFPRWVKLEACDFWHQKKGFFSTLGYEFTKLLWCCNRWRKEQVALREEFRARWA